MWKLTFVKVAVMSFFSIDLVSSTDFSRPNIVIFLVDDLGITDLGCFGNNTIQTPNIDRLAEEGARLIHDVHPDSVCTPNRAALLTGRYTIRLGLASDIDQLRMYVRTSTSGGLPRNEITVAEIASGAGYKTGRFQNYIGTCFHFCFLKNYTKFDVQTIFEYASYPVRVNQQTHTFDY